MNDPIKILVDNKKDNIVLVNRKDNIATLVINIPASTNVSFPYTFPLTFE